MENEDERNNEQQQQHGVHRNTHIENAEMKNDRKTSIFI